MQTRGWEPWVLDFVCLLNWDSSQPSRSLSFPLCPMRELNQKISRPALPFVLEPLGGPAREETSTWKPAPPAARSGTVQPHNSSGPLPGNWDSLESPLIMGNESYAMAHCAPVNTINWIFSSHMEGLQNMLSDKSQTAIDDMTVNTKRVKKKHTKTTQEFLDGMEGKRLHSRDWKVMEAWKIWLHKNKHLKKACVVKTTQLSKTKR